MLPTALPLLLIFRKITMTRANRNRLLLLLITGYLAVWAMFGLAAHGLDRLLLALARQIDWLTFNSWILGAIVFGLAGIYQFVCNVGVDNGAVDDHKAEGTAEWQYRGREFLVGDLVSPDHRKRPGGP